MTTQPDTAAAAPPAVPNPPPATVTPKTAAFAATDVLADEYDDGPDTVERARRTPQELQPHTELGLRDDEYDRIRQILGRRPTASELAMYSIMWSEHCSYKSSKVHLHQFRDKAPRHSRMLAGIGENAGVVQISDDLAVTFKVESHNHPSFVEPYQGAATGVGGIVRDILAMGAWPIGVMDSLRFGAADHPDTARVLPGVVAGIGGYGNCLGLPNIGGEVVFDPCYQGNPLVNALCVGVLPVARLQKKEAAGVGNVVVLLGARTGRDGIGGVSVLASATFDEGAEQRRPSVQVGDPFMEKLLVETCLELYDAGLVVGIQDLGGAGLTCALTETAAAAGTGMRIQLERVPLREPSMSPTEILASESQERMLLIVAPDKLDRVLQVAEKWGVWATAIGEVTPSDAPGQPGRLVITWNGHTVVDVPPGSLADDGPVYARPIREPADVILLQADRAETLPRPSTPDELRATVLRMIASPNLCDKGWVTEQYDRYVLGNTVLAQPEDAGVLRIDESTGLGVALSVDGNGRFARLDPYEGARLALAEAYRNVAVTGAEPAAVTDCLNFGSPEDPAVMWQFAEAVRGLADGCQELGIPVTGGNVSFYNQTGAAAIHPTPVVGVLGILDDVARRIPIGLPPPAADGDLLFLLGDTACELSGSEWAWVVHGHLGGRPPRVDLAREKALAGLLVSASQRGHITAAHDISDGGLAQVLVESCLRRNTGARVLLPEDEAFVYLFSESAGRALVAVPRGHDKAFAGLAAEHGVSCAAIGVTTEEPVLDVRHQFAIPLDELRTAYTTTLRELFGGAEGLANRHGDREHAVHPGEHSHARPAAAGTPTSEVGSPTVASQAAPPEAVEPDGPTDGAPAEDGGDPARSVTLELTGSDAAQTEGPAAESAAAVAAGADAESAESSAEDLTPARVSRDPGGSAIYTSSARIADRPLSPSAADDRVPASAPAGNPVPASAPAANAVPTSAPPDEASASGLTANAVRSSAPAGNAVPASAPPDEAAASPAMDDAVAASPGVDQALPAPGGPIDPDVSEDVVTGDVTVAASATPAETRAAAAKRTTPTGAAHTEGDRADVATAKPATRGNDSPGPGPERSATKS